MSWKVIGALFLTAIVLGAIPTRKKIGIYLPFKAVIAGWCCCREKTIVRMRQQQTETNKSDNFHRLIHFRCLLRTVIVNYDLQFYQTNRLL